ncbi:helix-turn-helix domain-containing protein [Thermomonospora umbrina]|uniref:Helix-turn-helix protein n=1 Tax=Thermomonospora umbrina TaxID=111806 RepID=A0A3D9SJU7_9ACTN|nr:helix-turn-helix transcriptional regulator [Thermomonospora umbrina]REE96192.1 helix-turn-helix protein [Thermomonospora umbrina]
MPPSKKGPTLRSQWLGKHLRELREAAGLTLREAGDHVQRDQGALSRWEAGLVPVRVPDVIALLNLYGVDDLRIRDGLERLSRDIWQKGWWDDYAGEAKTRILDYAWIESRATRVKSYDAIVVNGLLQIRDYAHAVMAAAGPEDSPTTLARWWEFRSKRQQELTSEDPLRLHAIVDEAVLHRLIGGAETMGAQLAHLVAMVELPNITIQVLPFSAGAHASPSGPFTVFEMPEPYPDLAYIETQGGSVYLEADGAEKFSRAYDGLQDSALSPEESAAFIGAHLSRLRQ